ncbi:MAG: biopolymer transporter ExbD, partial [Burkholderiales bacterium]|nr:biopolymer transporter ExbD [Burkholderiales bacterium]
MRLRRLRKPVAHLEITAFINLIVVLVPFLLSTAVFTHLAVIDLKLPQAAADALARIEPGRLQLEVVLRRDAIEVGDRAGGLIERIPRDGHEMAALAAAMLQIKRSHPEQRDATLLSEPEVPYDDLVQAMDAMRSTVSARGAQAVRVELFPQIAIGDAPPPGGAGNVRPPPGGAGNVRPP